MVRVLEESSVAGSAFLTASVAGFMVLILSIVGDLWFLAKENCLEVREGMCSGGLQIMLSTSSIVTLIYCCRRLSNFHDTSDSNYH